MIYEIVNPSDYYTLGADDPAIGAATCLLLGSGQYILRDEGGNDIMPFFIFGGDPSSWFVETYGVGIMSVMETRRDEIAECLESVLIGNRQEYIATLALITEDENRNLFVAEWHDRHRSSLNDIGGRAREIARRMREKE